MPAQCLFKRHVKVEHVGRAVVLGEDLAKHVAVVLRHENALDDDVVADAGAVADGVSDETDVLPVRV
jgi:hydrogenase maturation factor